MMKELKDTVEGMLSSDYKERFIAEYWQLKIRHDMLKRFCDSIEEAEMSGEESPKHDCGLGLLRCQQDAMYQYLQVLEVRAKIEDIDLS